MVPRRPALEMQAGTLEGREMALRPSGHLPSLTLLREAGSEKQAVRPEETSPPCGQGQVLC